MSFVAKAAKAVFKVVSAPVKAVIGLGKKVVGGIKSLFTKKSEPAPIPLSQASRRGLTPLTQPTPQQLPPRMQMMMQQQQQPLRSQLPQMPTTKMSQMPQMPQQDFGGMSGMSDMGGGMYDQGMDYGQSPFRRMRPGIAGMPGFGGGMYGM